MAEGKEERKSNEESVKLFMGQVPKHIDEVNIINDKVTRSSRGCCFVICLLRQEADKAVNACHNKQTLPRAKVGCSSKTCGCQECKNSNGRKNGRPINSENFIS